VVVVVVPDVVVVVVVEVSEGRISIIAPVMDPAITKIIPIATASFKPVSVAAINVYLLSKFVLFNLLSRLFCKIKIASTVLAFRGGSFCQL
jgi:hypothetical protein